MSRLILIDGNNIMNRAFFAIPPLNDAAGRNVNAVYGFMSIFFKAVADYSPTHVAVAFDSPWPTKRHEAYPEYKATRKTMDEGLAAQMPIIKELLTLMGIKNLSVAGIEADDIIASLAKCCGISTLILSGDRDMWQLVGDKVTVIYPKRGVTEALEITPKIMEAEYGLSPAQIIDYKALCGDSSDNVPGVPGIGDKTAKTLLNKYRSLDIIYESLDEMQGKVKESLIKNKDLAYMSRALVTLDSDVSLGCDLCGCEYSNKFSVEALEYVKALKFNTLIKKLEFSANAVVKEEDKIETARPPVSEISPSNAEELSHAVEELSSAKEVAIIIGEDIRVAPSPLIQYSFKLSSDNFLENNRYICDIESLRRIFESDSVKIVYDNKSLKHALSKYGIVLKNVVYDLSIMNYLARGHMSEGEKDLFSGFHLPESAAFAHIIRDILLSEIKSSATERLYFDVELPLSNLLFDMEKEGVKIDLQALNELSKKFTSERDALESEAYSLIKEKINLQSSKQLSELLYNKLNLPKGKKTKSGYSTDNDELVRLLDLHPIIQIILKHRQVSKLIGTYVEGMRQHICEGNIIHTTYNQTLTVTGRLSSSEPNLQNIPIRDNVGKEIRKLFIPKNDLLISADYSQIELRLLAELSGDEVLTEAFNMGKDIHTLVASEIFNLPSEMINDNMRRTAKAVNFGIIYGISDFGLSQNIGIAQGRAKTYIKKYFERYPAIRAYLDKSVSDAKQNKYITTISGRRRFLPELSAASARVRAFGERAAMNMPLQGSAADIMKIAMIGVHEELKKRALRSAVIMQVHDELVVDAYLAEKDIVCEILRDQMENAVKTRVKLTVNITAGGNLLEAK